MTSVIWTGVLLLTAFVLHRWWSKRRYRLFPGPGALPILGSAHHLPLEFQERAFVDWGKKYGDVMYFKLFQTPTVVLNSLKSARDLLDKRSAKYSDRPRMILLAELGGHDLSLPTLRYGDRFRKNRRWMHELVMNKSSLESYRPIQYRELHLMLRNLLESPEELFDHLFRYVAATILEITYGQRPKSMNDEIVQLAERAVTAVNEGGTPGSVLVDFFPFLKHIPTWMPGAGFKRQALWGRVCLKAWREGGVDMVKADMAAGTGSPCVISSLLAAHKGLPNQEELEDIKALGVSIYGAGTETTIGSLRAFFLAMVRNPHVFRKAQEEIDRVVGSERLPDFGDRESLPYTNALLEELYRWSPGLPLAIPHRVMSHDQYQGYDIPEGCMIMPNIWGMSRDPQNYPDPEEFCPERHLKQADSGRELPSSFVFGFGRRICPGQALADANLWLAIASVVAMFDICKPRDSSGKEYTPPADFKPGFTRQPKPFLCKIVSRSGKTTAVI